MRRVAVRVGFRNVGGRGTVSISEGTGSRSFRVESWYSFEVVSSQVQVQLLVRFESGSSTSSGWFRVR